MLTSADPLVTLTDLLHRDGWEVQLAGVPAAPPPTPSARGVAYVVPVGTPLETPGAR